MVERCDEAGEDADAELVDLPEREAFLSARLRMEGKSPSVSTSAFSGEESADGFFVVFSNT
jgi:hypothetical protein